MAQVVDLTALLHSAQNPDHNARTAAEQQLQQLQENQYATFLVSLSAELSNNEKPSDTRRLAGLIIKNALDAKEESRKAALVQQWLSLEPGVKQQIKQSLLGTLAAQVGDVRHTAALVIAKVAAIEIPKSQWPELVNSLLSNMNVQPPNPGMRSSTMEALGYVCEELGALDEDYLEQTEVNSILTAVAQGMRKEEDSVDVRQAATVALTNALEFASTNFGNDNERNYIMQIVCEATIADDVKIRQAAWECLVRVATCYYVNLPAYMQDIFTLSQRAVTHDEEAVALQAIEFWCTICEEELDKDDEGDSTEVNHKFIKAALPHLVPMLMEQLTKQEEGQEEDDGAWNLSMAAGTCLGLCSAVEGDAIVQLVMPFVQANIQKTGSQEDWRFREAATFAFGSILEGPSVETLSQLARSGLGFLLSALKDSNPSVKNTTAWTIGRIFEYVHSEDLNPPLIDGQVLPQIIQVLLEAIKDAPHIAEKVCYAISQLAAGFDATSSTSPMSPYFKDIVQSLLETAARPAEVNEQARLQTQAFEAINEVVRSSATDVVPMVVQLLPLFIGKLRESCQAQPQSAEAAERQSEIQGLLCGVIQVIVQKLSEAEEAKAGVLQYADHIMEALLHVFACRKDTVHEEAMLAVGAMTYACGRQFVKYMDKFLPVLEMGLSHHREWQVCSVSVGVLGDICRAIEEQILPYCDRVMILMVRNLQSNEVHRNIKPQILSAFGDIALAIGDKFVVYLQHVLQMLQSAMTLSVQQLGNDDLADYNNSLRHGILEAWSGIFNGMSREKADEMLKSASPAIIEYIEAIASDQENQDDAVWKAAVALLGDLASSVSGVGVLFQQKPYVLPFIQRCSQDPAMADTAKWAGQMVQKAMQG